MNDIVKENSLNVETAQTALMYLRLVVDRFTGESKLEQIQDLRLEISNTNGLAALLAASQALVTGHENEIPKFNALGQIESSGINVGTFSTDAELAALVDDGTYTFVYDTAYVSLPLCGIVYFVAINNGHRILYTDNGLWHSVYFEGWGLERYIGGAFDNITISYADAVTQAAASQLSPGASYKITGTGQNVGLILRAASANEFESDGIVLALIPKHSIGTHGATVWGGHWAANMATPTANHYYTFYGRVWKSVTGAIGTATGFDLDATNWLLLDPLTETDFYTQVTHGCSYLLDSGSYGYPYGFIYSRWDAKGNTLSEIVPDADGFTSDMNDWHLDIDGGQFNGNILRRIYNNTISSTGGIVGQGGNGDIYDTRDCDIRECVLPDENNNIRHAIEATLSKCILGGTADIQYLASGSNLSNNTINGDVKGDSTAYSLITLTDSTIEYGGEIKDNIAVSVEKSKIRGLIDGNTAAILYNVVMDYGSFVRDNTLARVFNSRLLHNADIVSSNHQTYYYNDSVIDTTKTGITLSAVTVIRDDNTPFKATTGETFRLDTPVYEDINTAIANGKASPANYPTWAAFDTNLGSFTFALNDYLDLGTVEIPHSYKEGTNLEIHLHIATNGLNNATARKVKYIIYYSYAIPDNGANQFTAEASLTSELDIPANQAAKSAFYLSMGTITGTTIKIGTQLKMRVKRIAGTSTEPINDPFLGQVGIHFQKDTLGSRTISAK